MHSLLFLQRITRTSPVPSSTSICTCLIFPRKFQMAPTCLTMWSGCPSFKTNLSESHTAEWIIFAVTGISVCAPLSEAPFCNRHAWWLPLVDKRFVINKSVAVSIFFFWTWCDKQCYQARLHHSNRRRWFFVWGLFLSRANWYQNQWNTALMEAAIVSKMQTLQSHFDFLNNSYWVSLF